MKILPVEEHAKMRFIFSEIYVMYVNLKILLPQFSVRASKHLNWEDIKGMLKIFHLPRIFKYLCYFLIQLFQLKTKIVNAFQTYFRCLRY